MILQEKQEKLKNICRNYWMIRTIFMLHNVKIKLIPSRNRTPNLPQNDILKSKLGH